MRHVLGYLMKLLSGALMAIALAGALVPASAAPQRQVSQAEYEQFLQCLGVVHARTDMIFRLAANVKEKAYAEQLKTALSGATKLLVSLKGLIEQANPGLDVKAGEAARDAARAPYDGVVLKSHAEQLSVFIKDHGQGERLYTSECGARCCQTYAT